MSASGFPKIRLGVSACLLGRKVRYDGGHKKDPFVVDLLGRHAELVPVCPEVELGLGTPRPTLRLVQGEGGVRLQMPAREEDLTSRMEAFAQERVGALCGEVLDGFVLKKDSPSCGLVRVKVYPSQTSRARTPARTGQGLFAQALAAGMPLLPLEDEGRLHDAVLRANFVERVFVHRRWRLLQEEGLSAKALQAFHAGLKLAVLAHSPVRYVQLGRLVSGVTGRTARRVAAEYGPSLMDALTLPASRGRHANVLQHLAGHLKDALSRDDRAELAALIDQYRQGEVPRLAPITLLRHHFRHHPHPWVEQQTYLRPYPDELMMRGGD